uniref:Chromo domain-containing protein n=1 Tax=Romanomermis culicivorax TaxID=13658 RepID=A0A915JYV2_ROMCU
MEPITGNVFAAECIKKSRMRKGKIEYLIKWKGWSSKYDSWEPPENILDNRLIQNFEKKQVKAFQQRNCPLKKPEPRATASKANKRKRKRNSTSQSSSSDSFTCKPSTSTTVQSAAKRSSKACRIDSVSPPTPAIETPSPPPVVPGEERDVESPDGDQDAVRFSKKVNSVGGDAERSSRQPTVAPLVIKISSHHQHHEVDEALEDEREGSSCCSENGGAGVASKRGSAAAAGPKTSAADDSFSPPSLLASPPRLSPQGSISRSSNVGKNDSMFMNKPNAEISESSPPSSAHAKNSPENRLATAVIN